jgi:hypothetical protein
MHTHTYTCTQGHTHTLVHTHTHTAQHYYTHGEADRALAHVAPAVRGFFRSVALGQAVGDRTGNLQVSVCGCVRVRVRLRVRERVFVGVGMGVCGWWFC